MFGKLLYLWNASREIYNGNNHAYDDFEMENISCRLASLLPGVDVGGGDDLAPCHLLRHPPHHLRLRWLQGDHD